MKFNTKGEIILTTSEWKELIELINSGVCIDGEHHKQWYFEQLGLMLNLELDEHDEGIAP